MVKGALYSVQTWGRGLNAWDSRGVIGYLSEPTEILTLNGTGPLATGPFQYNNTYYGSSIQGSHYVIEGSIPRSAFDEDDWHRNINVHWTETCGNDAIDLKVSTPEPASLTLLGLGLLGLLVRKRKK